MRMSQLFVRWRFEALGCLAFLVWWNPWLTAADHGAATLPTVGHIERLDPRFDALVPPDATIEVLAMGFAWSEGPVWVADDRGGLPAGFTRICRLRLGAGKQWGWPSTIKAGCSPVNR